MGFSVGPSEISLSPSSSTGMSAMKLSSLPIRGGSTLC